jgi:opacity protein-like surface antigen
VGSYLGVDFINTALRYEQINIMPANYENLDYFNGIPRERAEKQYKSKDGFAIKYLYAINFNGIFLAPEIFYHHINLKLYDRENDIENTDMTLPSEFGYRYNKIHNQYGAKLNLGYDINSDFALYGFVGISRVRYSNLYSLYPYHEIETVVKYYSSINNPIINYNEAFKVYNGTATAPVYGFGGKIKLSKRFYLNGEYMISDFYSKTNSKKFIKKDGELYESNSCSSMNKLEMCNNNRQDAIKLRNSLRIFKIGITFNF